MRKSPASVAHAVLDLAGEFSKGLAVAEGHEDRVVAKAASSPHLGGEDSLHRPVKGGEGHPVLRDSQHTTEAGRSLLMGHPLCFFEHKSRILLVGASGSGIPRRIDPGLLAERIDFESRVIGQHDPGDMEGDPLGLQTRIGLEACPGFLDFREFRGARGIGHKNP